MPTPIAEQILQVSWPENLSVHLLLTGADMLHQYPPSSLTFASINNYGPTEATVVATSGRIAPTDDPALAPSIGRPISNTQVALLDASLQLVPFGVRSEIFLGGAGLARCYLNQRDETSVRFDLAHFLREKEGIKGSVVYRVGLF